MKIPQLTADDLSCPHCHSEQVHVLQVGHFCNTLLLSCEICGLTSVFKGPEVKEESK